MTTPAVSLDQISNVSTELWARIGDPCTGTFQLSNTASGIQKRVTESRPASINNVRQKSGWRNPSAWSHSKIVHNPVPNSTVRQINSSPNCSGNFSEYRKGYYWRGMPVSSVPTFPSALQQRARSRALLQLKRNRPNIAIALAERKETADLFNHAATSIAQSVRKFKGKNPREWGQVLKNGTKNQFRGIPQSWLEMQYGWKPLMSDVSSACESISKREQDAKIYKIRVIGTAKEKSITYRDAYGSVHHAAHFHVRDEVIHTCKVVLYYNLANGALAAFSSLGLTNPLELVWERVKYSFVVDWFIPIGSWLSTLDADVGWDFSSGTQSSMTRLVATSEFRTDPSNFSALGIKSMSLSGDSYHAEGFNFSRSVFSSSPWAGLPSFKNPLSGIHVANALALLQNAFRR